MLSKWAWEEDVHQFCFTQVNGIEVHKRQRLALDFGLFKTSFESENYRTEDIECSFSINHNSPKQVAALRPAFRWASNPLSLSFILVRQRPVV